MQYYYNFLNNYIKKIVFYYFYYLSNYLSTINRAHTQCYRTKKLFPSKGIDQCVNINF